MNTLDALWHLLNLFAPAVLLTALASLLTKLLWWRELRSVAWWRLWAWSALAAALATVAGLVLLGHDGKMAGYAGMVLACTLGLWWAAFGPGRR